MRNFFLDVYFQYFKEPHKNITWHIWLKKLNNPEEVQITKDNPDLPFRALLPLPQAHLYLENPLERKLIFSPTNMFKVDFVFWDGKGLTAIEIDGSSHIGSEAHIQKDRTLQRAGVPVIHILNSELVQYRTKAIKNLFPTNILHYWEHIDTSDFYFPMNPLQPPF